MVRPGLVLLLIFLALSAFSRVVQAEVPYDSLKARYFKLRNTDVSLKAQADWVALADELVGFAYAHPQQDNAAHALLQAAILHEQLYRKTKIPRDLDEALELLALVIKEYPKHVLADDALVRRAELLLRERRDNKGALAEYQLVIARYPQGDMYQLSRARAAAIKQGTIGELHLAQSEKLPQPNKDPLRIGGRIPVIVIDPGHGGEDFGAVGIGGILEKDVVLSIALELERLLVEELGATVRLTRRTDQFVPLAERTNMANDFEADLFISLHGNSSPSGKAYGHETYILDNSGEQGSVKLAERENASLAYEGTEADLQFMLSDLIQAGKLEDSITLAQSVQSGVISGLKKKWKGIRDLGVRKAPFFVLVGAHMPCILVEMFFLNNPEDGKKIGRADFRKDLARGVFSGVRGYLVKRKDAGVR